MDSSYFFFGDDGSTGTKVSTNTVKIKPSGSLWINRQTTSEIHSITEWNEEEKTQIASIIVYRSIENHAVTILSLFALIIHIIISSHNKNSDSSSNKVLYVSFWILIGLFFVALGRKFYTDWRLRGIFEPVLARCTTTTTTGGSTIHVSPTLSSDGRWISRQSDEELLSLGWKEEDVVKVQDLISQRGISYKRYRYSFGIFVGTYLVDLLVLQSSSGLGFDDKFPWISFWLTMIAFIAGLTFLFVGFYNRSRWGELNHELNTIMIRSFDLQPSSLRNTTEGGEGVV